MRWMTEVDWIAASPAVAVMVLYVFVIWPFDAVYAYREKRRANQGNPR